MDTLIKVDIKASPIEQDVIHPRWHPNIPIINWVKP